MILFCKDSIYPLIKITTPSDINFYNEHQKLMQENGYTWFCRFGKSNMKIESIKNCGNTIIIKESKKNGDKVYAAIFDEILGYIDEDKVIFPAYYNNIKQNKELWFRLVALEEYSKEMLCSAFVVNASNNDVSSILKSMCPATFLRCKIQHYLN